MASPYRHSVSSAKRFGGTWEDYIEIHRKMDCSKGYFPDSRHRSLTHTMFWVLEVMVPLFGDVIELDDGKKVSVKDICEQHILEDFGMKFIPTVQDYMIEMKETCWMLSPMKFSPQSTENKQKRKKQ